MRPYILRFFRDNAGAVTVDWVVLTAAIVGLAAGAGISAGLGIDNASTTIKGGIEGVTVNNE
ncbi:hypothetical protein OO012_09615 [Rhodobacteraceae bacterium KMM 6894]|nr:hypothetical protein [Rhodobacteraceae bacterium KMM 6894]